MSRYLVVLLFLWVASSRAGPPPIMQAEDAIRQNLLISHPPPEYPYEARQKSITGAGIFDLRFDFESGRLHELHVTASTGQPILDAAVIAALKRWQAKPRVVHTVRVPVTFNYRGRGFRYELPHEHG